MLVTLKVIRMSDHFHNGERSKMPIVVNIEASHIYTFALYSLEITIIFL